MILNELAMLLEQNPPLSRIYTSFTSLLSRQILLLRSSVFLLIPSFQLLTSYFWLLLVTSDYLLVHVLALPKNKNICRIALSHNQKFYCKYIFTLSWKMFRLFLLLMYKLNCTKICKDFYLIFVLLKESLTSKSIFYAHFILKANECINEKF